MARTIEHEGETYIHIDYLKRANASAERRGKERDLLRKALICADHVDWGLSQAEAAEVRRILGNGVIT